MKFNTLLVFLFATLFIAGCTPAPTPTPTDDMADMPETGAVADTDDTAGETGEVADTDDDIRTISITANGGAYFPNTITVRKGEKVKLVINDEETKHGAKFDTMMVTEVEGGFMLDTSTVGTFGFACAAFCDEGHDDMKGTVIVTE